MKDKMVREFIKLRGRKLTAMRKDFDDCLANGVEYTPCQLDLDMIDNLDRLIVEKTRHWGI